MEGFIIAFGIAFVVAYPLFAAMERRRAARKRLREWEAGMAEAKRIHGENMTILAAYHARRIP